MPRVQVYLPDDLHREMKAHKIKASELFQAAVRAEVERLEKLAALDDYIADLIAEVGEPTAAQLAAAAERLGIPLPEEVVLPSPAGAPSAAGAAGAESPAADPSREAPAPKAGRSRSRADEAGAGDAAPDVRRAG